MTDALQVGPATRAAGDRRTEARPRWPPGPLPRRLVRAIPIAAALALAVLASIGGLGAHQARWLWPAVAGGLVLTEVTSARDHARLQRQLTYRATHDALTGLANRACFADRLVQMGSELRGDAQLAVLCIDLDDFRTVNDGLGHHAGDQLLTTVAARLLGLQRPVLTARLGGDEFGLLVADATEPESRAIASRILDIVEQPVHVAGRTVQVSASIGVTLGGPELQPDDLLRHADVAMYSAKGLGKGRYQLFEPAMGVAVAGQLGTREHLEWALRRGELELHYQPVVVMDSGRISGFEALLRWRHPQRGLMAPVDFLPVAERLGLLVDFERWVLREACVTAVRWPTVTGGAAARVGVNLCPAHIQHPDVVAHVVDALRDSGLDASRLVVEVTEEALVQDADAAVRNLAELKRLGVSLALDDFGTGYSSLSYLDRLPVDTIKIDRSFIDTSRWPFVTAILHMTRHLGIDALAEGVETAEHHAWLRDAGCIRAQGFYYSRPMPAADVAPWLGEHALRLGEHDRPTADPRGGTPEPGGPAPELAVPI